jgi:hypothetical protein
VTIEPYFILALFFGLVPLSWVVNRPKALRHTPLDSLVSVFLSKDVSAIEPSGVVPNTHSTVRIPPMLNLRTTPIERQAVELPKPSMHCQNCRHCFKTAVVDHVQWIYCDNPFRVTTNGSNKHYWHRPEVKLPCYAAN